MNWISRKIHLYNVTMGLYMLDWWERYLFRYSGLSAFLTLVDILILILLWFICYNGSRFATEFYESYLKSGLLAGGNSAMEGVYHPN